MVIEKITKENVLEVIEVLNKAQWVNEKEADFLTEVLTFMRDNYGDNSAKETLSIFAYTVGDMNMCLGYPLTDDPHHSYYASKLGKSSFFITGNIRYAIGEFLVKSINTLHFYKEKNNRDIFYTFDKEELTGILSVISGDYSHYEEPYFIEKKEELDPSETLDYSRTGIKPKHF